MADIVGFGLFKLRRLFMTQQYRFVIGLSVGDLAPTIRWSRRRAAGCRTSPKGAWPRPPRRKPRFVETCHGMSLPNKQTSFFRRGWINQTPTSSRGTGCRGAACRARGIRELGNGEQGRANRGVSGKWQVVRGEKIILRHAIRRFSYGYGN